MGIRTSFSGSVKNVLNSAPGSPGNIIHVLDLSIGYVICGTKSLPRSGGSRGVTVVCVPSLFPFEGGIKEIACVTRTTRFLGV